MFRSQEISDMPDDLLEAFYIKMMPYVGIETMNKFNAAVKKYPEFFPWETTYNSLPKEVHDAYFKEANPWHDEPWASLKDENGEPSIGLLPTLMKQRNELPIETNEPPQTIMEIFQNVLEAQEKSRKKKMEYFKKEKAIWDKHYSKYKLEYRVRLYF